MPANDPLEAPLREEVVRTCRRLVELGMNQGAAGNVSVRLGDGFLATPSGIGWDELEPEQLATVDGPGQYRGPCLPTSEWRLHAAVLRVRPAVGAVIHTHSVYATTIACLRLDLPALHYYIVAGGGATIRCAPYATFGTQALADNVVATLADADACLMANHGLLVVGSTLAQTLRRTVDIETLARQYVYARMIGEPVILPDDEIERVRVKMRTYGTPDARDPDLVRIDAP
jgi:L-fuculose-phosphate aldolase